MARTASIAVAGYYPTPPELLAALAALVTPHPDAAHPDAWLDPCCGKGEALAGIARELYPKAEGFAKHRVALYAVEAEEGRHASAREELRDFASTTWGSSSLYRGDALRAEVTTDSEHVGVSGLYLNPPYDTDPRSKRLEERFLRHYTPALAPEGVLLFVVPAHALTASADTLATAYRDVAVLRFPDDHYAAFKQVVLIARKRVTPLPMPHSATAALVRTAAEAPLDLPVLGAAVRPWKLPTVTGRERFGVGLTIRPVSPDALAGAYKPWGVTLRGGATREALNTHPASATAGLERRYPAAMPLKPGHLAAALAAGVFNGECVVADDPACGAPPLLVKGVFKREWHTVEEKVSKDGEHTGDVQVEAPRLEVTVLDLTTGGLHTLAAVPEPSGSTSPAEMTTGDLLVTYSRTLLAAMRAHCPPDYAPDREAQHFPLVQSSRPLYRAQEHACRGVVTQLGGPGLSAPSRRGKYATLIGEVGSGKSGVFLIASRTAGATRVLILCPPHLLTGWGREAAAVWPEARVVVLDSVARIEALAADTGGPVVALLTRETAKLGHGWVGVPVCPACGTKDSRPADVLATKRAACTGAIRTPKTPAQARALDYARRLGGHAEFHSALALGFNRRVTLTARAAADGVLRDAAGALRLATDPETTADLVAFLSTAALTAAAPALRLDLASALAPHSAHAAARLLATVDPDAVGWSDTAAVVAVAEEHWSTKLDKTVARTWRGDLTVSPWETFQVSREGWDPAEGRERLTIGGLPVGSAKHLDDAVLAGAVGAATRVCGEPLYQATASPVGTSPFGGTPGAGPRRYPLATYIARRHPRLFDFLGLDEAHEYGNDGSAQERAAHRLTSTRVPTVQLTGSLVNGYARHLFANLWGLDVEFRAAFAKDGVGKFAQQYGYRRRFVDAEGKVKGSDRGAVTDRVEGGIRDMGEAPGVQPLAVLRYVVRHAATLHKAELDTGVPELVTELVPVDPDPDALTAHKAMLAALVRQVKADAFTDRSGALWGQLAEAPSHLDRITDDVGNTAEGAWVVCYPEHRGGGVVHRVEGIPAATVLPKESWAIAKCKAEVAAGRPVIVLAWHTALFPRLHRLLRAAGLRVSVLDANRVGAAKRQVWIEAQIAKGVDVLVTNPVAIQTGLNCLTHFATTVWMQNPACNAIVFRQANGRIDRIGQKQAPRCFVPVYRGSTQEALHTLLMRKVAVSQSTDGLDARSALQATGVGEVTAMSTLSVGKLLFDLLDKGA